MLYMPVSTFATPIVLQETKSVPTANYVMLQPTTMFPTVPLFNTALVYPGFSLVAKSIEKDDTNKSQKQEATQPVQHVIHHHTCGVKTCPGYCELCCPWIEHSTEQRTRCRSRSRSPSPPRTQYQQRCSRRDEFDRSKYENTHESIDDKIERIRRELHSSSICKHDKSTETIDYYRPPPSPPVVQCVPYKQHYDAPKPRSLSRPRSASSQRASSLPREPWRSSNQNDYPWRDSHLPAYRAETLARSQTPVDESRTCKETAHHRSHLQTQNATTYCSKKDYIYRPKSETEARKWYTQSTGKDPDREVHQALHGGTTNYTYTGSSTCCYDRSDHHHSFYSEIPSKIHSLHKVDSTQYHNLYGCNEPCLHIVPKQGGTLDPPYLKILNAPVTYLH